jgi:hypothetical protein
LKILKDVLTALTLGNNVISMKGYRNAANAKRIHAHRIPPEHHKSKLAPVMTVTAGRGTTSIFIWTIAGA